MPEYAKMKNAELEVLLKERGLTVGGKKADMVDRLIKDDDEKAIEKALEADSAPTAGAKPVVASTEDVINWDDDDEDTAPAPTSTAPTTATTTQVPESDVAKPQDAPTQVADIDATKTADLSVKAPENENVQEKAEEAAGEKVEEKVEETKAPVPDYTKGLAATSLEEEIEKRKKRAAKFGLKVEDDEGLKLLERAKKFGETGPPKGLDEALSEQRPNKRGRDANDQGGRPNKERRGNHAGGRQGRGNRNGDRRRDDRGPREPRAPRAPRTDNKSRPNNGAAGGFSEADRLKAEERKKRFAAPPKAST